MTTTKNRLGRGLGALIAGGAPENRAPSSKALPSKNKASTKTAVSKGKAETIASKKGYLTPKKKMPLQTQAKKTSQIKTSPQKIKTKILSGSKVKPKSVPSGSLEVPPPIADAPSSSSHPDYQEILLDWIDPNPHQPRRDIDAEKVQELAESIRSEGLLQPLVVRKVRERYELIAGERRLRACRFIGMKKVPCRVTAVSDASSAVIALIENLQREDLNPIEESMGYASLMRDFDLTQEAVAERLGKSRSSVANALRLLQLDREIQNYLSKGLLSVGHAKVLLGLEEASERLILARRMIEEGLSVRDAERAIRRMRAELSSTRTGKVGQTSAEHLAVRDLERQIAQKLGTKVLLKHNAKRGRLVIEYYGNDDLQRILDKTGLSL